DALQDRHGLAAALAVLLEDIDGFEHGIHDAASGERVVHQVTPTKRSCIGRRSHSGVTGLPLRDRFRRAALTLAVNIPVISRINRGPASQRVCGIWIPTAAASSRMPVTVTSKSGLGNAGGTIATRSLRIRLKWADAVSSSIAERPNLAAAVQLANASTPRAPAARKRRVETTRMTTGMMTSLSAH